MATIELFREFKPIVRVVMAKKTYLPKLVALLHTICRYIVRYRPTIDQFLDAQGKTLLNAVVAACEAFTAYVVIEHGE